MGHLSAFFWLEFGITRGHWGLPTVLADIFSRTAREELSSSVFLDMETTVLCLVAMASLVWWNSTCGKEVTLHHSPFSLNANYMHFSINAKLTRGLASNVHSSFPLVFSPLCCTMSRGGKVHFILVSRGPPKNSQVQVCGRDQEGAPWVQDWATYSTQNPGIISVRCWEGASPTNKHMIIFFPLITILLYTCLAYVTQCHLTLTPF